MRCHFCHRGPHKVLSRSHSNRATIRRQHLNLTTRRINGRKVRICTSCLKTKTRL